MKSKKLGNLENIHTNGSLTVVFRTQLYTSSRVFRKLGRLDELLEQFSGNQEQMMLWARQEAVNDTENYSSKNTNVSIMLSQTAYIPKNEERSFNVGYLFLQKICTDLCKNSVSI